MNVDSIKFTKKKITGKNLSSQVSKSQKKDTTSTSNSGRRLLVLGPSKRGGRKKKTSLAPVNTSSLKKENNGQDTSVTIVPSGGTGWGTDKNGDNQNETDHSSDNTKGDDGKTVWGSNAAGGTKEPEKKKVGKYRPPTMRWGDEVEDT